MRKISDAIQSIIEGHPFLKFGVSRKLFNLTQLARLLAPHIAAQTRKDIRESAVVMALSRYAKEVEPVSTPPDSYRVSSIHVQDDLVILTYPQAQELTRRLLKLTQYFFNNEHYITITQGLTEVTIILEKSALAKALELLHAPPSRKKDHISSISIRFSSKLIQQPGFLHFVLEQLSLQGINVVEIASTATEFIIYLDSQNIRLAFDTLHAVFQKRESGASVLR